MVLAAPALAQDPKPGDYYEDKTDLGFKIKMPAKWESIPPAPDDGNLIIKYDPKSTKDVQLGPSTRLRAEKKPTKPNQTVMNVWTNGWS